MQIGDRIKEIRGKLSQSEFAKSLDIAQRTLANYERNERTPNVNFAYDLAQKYNVSLIWLLTGQGPMKQGESLVQGQTVTEGTSNQKAPCSRCEQLEADNRELRQDNRELRLENKDLRQENRDLRDENRRLRESQKQDHFAPKTEQNDSTNYSTEKDQYDLKGASPP